MDGINALTNVTIRPLPEREPQRPAAIEPVAAQPRNRRESPERATRNRYRVDQAYRNYHDARERQGADNPRSTGDARRVSSAKLLETMIHQMGGAELSSAKGVFVDIAV